MSYYPSPYEKYVRETRALQTEIDQLREALAALRESRDKWRRVALALLDEQD